MKKHICALLLALPIILNAHTIDYASLPLHHWTLQGQMKGIDGSFFMYKNGDVYIENAKNELVHFPITSFSKDDQAYVQKRQSQIVRLNAQLMRPVQAAPQKHSIFNAKFLVALLIIFALGAFAYSSIGRPQLKYLTPVLLVGIVTLLFGFSGHVVKSLRATTTNPLTIDSAFTPYTPNVITSWDTVYFYVGSYGIPSPAQQMMAGITAWNEQVPLPQCYIGSNVWSIPLNPVLAPTPIPVTPHTFTRGAIGLAVNGVPIFNEYTNTGTDAYLAGQLDSFGGHSGRADDYHYHIAPLFLQNATAPILPIAYAFDGYAVYGTKEPDGNLMMPLDTNHGHYWTNGIYHYHGTMTNPYMIKNFVGKVYMDSTLQLDPQAASHPVRGGQNPLTGATITACYPNCVNGYTLVYTLNGQTDSIVYNWTSAGVYTYKFYINGTDTATQTYHSFTPCYNLPLCAPTSVNNIVTARGLSVYPNPSGDEFYLRCDDPSLLNQIKTVSVYNLNGETIYENNSYAGKVNLKNADPGVYIVRVTFEGYQWNQKLIVSSTK